jgi:hypothetical protein
MNDKPRQLTPGEAHKAVKEKLPEGWETSVKVLPDGHTQIRTSKRPPEKK